jgi:hypothetical protein
MKMRNTVMRKRESEKAGMQEGCRMKSESDE